MHLLSSIFTLSLLQQHASYHFYENGPFCNIGWGHKQNLSSHSGVIPLREG